MSCNVFANNNEIACKKGSNKVIAEFPDVCLSPPSPPAGPVPVPYPNTSFSKDMKNGSKTIKIKGGEVMLKDQSFYKTSPLGNEAATKSFGANVITHTITGKTYFVAWSMDVKFEGKNVDRHMDMTTSNHNSPPGGTGPTGMSAGSTSLIRKWPEQTCDGPRREQIKKQKDKACNELPGGSMSPSKVSPKKLAKIKCSVIIARIKKQQKCLRMRLKMQKECFNKGPDQTDPDQVERDRVHKVAIKDARNGIKRSKALANVNCAARAPTRDI